jgi:sporulation protein YlmC with PRC-barrel domain
MIRRLLATTAMTIIVAGSALAQEAAAPAEGTAPSGTAIFSTEPGAAMKSENGYFTAAPGQILASAVMGKSVYASAQPDAQSVGDINDVLMSADGKAEAVIIGVGGFLGMGEKDVAIDFERLTWVERNGERWLTASLTKEELEAAPAFNRSEIAMTTAGAATPAENAAGGETATARQPAVEAPADAAPAGQTAAAEKPAADETTAATSNGQMSQVEAGTLSAENLMGARVYGANDADLGEISDVMMTADGKVDAYVIDVGGFLGIGEKPVALEAASLKVMRNEAGSLFVYTAFTEDQLKSQAAFSKEAYEKDRNSVILR